ncbi:MAG: GNAT family N-acetyltransferase [Bryobacteraceae bacterium]|nr:GNAT family N-acetyltransferase [Bryobacteraceae bacterium]
MQPLLAPMTGALDKLLKLEYLDQFCDETHAAAPGLDFLGETLNRLNISVDISPEDLARVPKTGPVVAVANHPFGMAEGIALISLLGQLRPDFRVLANDMLGALPDVRPFLIMVDPFGGESAHRANRRSLREALQWLQKGGMLLMFPAGEVSHVHFRHPGIRDSDWNRTAAALIKHSGAAALPFYFEGANSALFQIAGLVHPRLRTALLPRELLNKQGQVLHLRVGHPAAAATFESLDDEGATDLLRRRTYWLAHRKPRTEPLAMRIHADDPLFAPIPADWLRAELAALPAERLLAESGNWQVILATRDECPFVVREIGRLREQTFRKAGEGTGKQVDLDDFDDHYLHLALWRKDLHEIAGAYRLCGTDRAEGRLYTKTLYRFSPQFFDRISPAVELGRSFIRLEHQRSFQPLRLLWRAIGEYVARNPRYRFLFGPVSISNSYQKANRVLMADTLLRLVGMPEIASLAKPRRPFIHLPVNDLPEPESIADMESWIADLEPTGAGLPVLIRQYLKMGGRFATFHVDHSFGQTLDGLIVVDLTKTEPKFLERYLGKDGAARFRAYHNGVGANAAAGRSQDRS